MKQFIYLFLYMALVWNFSSNAGLFSDETPPATFLNSKLMCDPGMAVRTLVDCHVQVGIFVDGIVGKSVTRKTWNKANDSQWVFKQFTKDPVTGVEGWVAWVYDIEKEGEVSLSKIQMSNGESETNSQNLGQIIIQIREALREQGKLGNPGKSAKKKK